MLVAGGLAVLPNATALPASAVSPVASALSNRVGIGVAAAPDNSGLTGWMPNSGVPWDYAYQYLAAGVNTGSGWATWNENAQFPLWYAQSAHSHGYTPVFPYYMLLQSNGPCSACDEAEKDLAHLNDAPLMASFYADFALLMKRLGAGTYSGVTGYGGTAIVQVEPDLSGYANQAVLDNAGRCYSHCTGQGNDPALLKASVASSGVTDVAGYANTYKGFSQALAHLRDLYAPNVTLAFHVSGWATLYDADSNTDTTVDIRARGRMAGAFAVASGVGSGYALVFNDVADRDAAYYKFVVGRNVWWDRNNVTLPNFHQWESYLQGVRDVTSAPFVVWQVPVGNQVYRTMSNTDGHYQDNRAEYFFAHIPELSSLGIIGLMFGAGAGGPTNNYDAKGDGVTNPASFCTTDGTSTGQICNVAVSTSSDDDGGYLRETAGAYYRTLGSLSSVLSRLFAIYGQSVSVSGTLACEAAPAGGRSVAIQRRPTGVSEFTTIGTQMTAADGTIPPYDDRPSSSSEYRLMYAGASDCAAATSPARRVGVRPGVIVNGPSSPLAAGTTAAVGGSIVPTHPGRRVQLQVFDGGAHTWRVVGAATLDGSSRYRFTYRRASAGYLLFRVAFPTQDSDHEWNLSRNLRVDWR